MTQALTGSIHQYIASMKEAPFLTETEEHELVMKYINYNNLNAVKQLIVSHIRYVVMIAYEYKGYGLALEDLIQEGTVGLMKAVKKFNPAVGVRLASYACHYIKGEMTEFIIKNWRMVKMATTKPQRKLFFNLRRAKTEFKWLSSSEITKISKDLSVSEKDVREMEARMYGHDIQLDNFDVDDNSDYTPTSAVDLLQLESDNTPDQFYEHNKEDSRIHVVTKALAKLSERDKDIVMSRNFNEVKTTLDDLSAKYEVSKERIRQIEKRSLEKIKEYVVA